MSIPTPRRRLPSRRDSQTSDLVFRNLPIVVTLGFHANGEIGEVFLNIGKTGADVQNLAHDAAVILSLAIQNGVGIADIQHAMTRDGASPASVLGAIADFISSEFSSKGGPR